MKSNSEMINSAMQSLIGGAGAKYGVDTSTSQFSEAVASVAEIAQAERLRMALEESDQMAKSFKYGHLVANPSENAKNSDEGMQSVRIDDTRIGYYGDYIQKNTGLSPAAMRMMVQRTPILNAIILTRIRQIKRFCHVSPDGRSPGFQVRYRDRTKKVTKEMKKVTSELESFLLNCGWEFNPRTRQRLKRDNFGGFMSKIIRDSLTMDAAAIETEFSNDKKGMVGFYAVDGGTVRYCSELGYQGIDEIFAVQVIDGQIRTTYTYDDLIFVPRNPTTDLNYAGYGVSEIELLIRIVTGFLNAMEYNQSYFDDNQIPKGILHLVGDYSQEDISAFKRYWSSLCRGIQNTWNMPVLTSKTKEGAVNFEKFGVDMSDVQFSKWMTFLTAIACAIYGIAPDEINFESFSASSTSTLSGSDTEEKIVNSKDKGLIPLFSYFQELISDYIISGFSPDLEFVWCGLDQKDTKQIWAEEQKILTLNEVRTQRGFDPVPDGDVQLDDGLRNFFAKEKAAAEQQELAAQQGEQSDYGKPGARDYSPDGGAFMPGGDQPGVKQAPDGVQDNPSEFSSDGFDFSDGDDDQDGDMFKAFGFPLMRKGE